jgi:hypothetical protein
MPDEQRDFFISFNNADEAYAKAISEALRAEGFTTFFHPDDLEIGGYIPKWMDDALSNSRQMLALCSPEYMGEGAVYSEAERYARVWQDTRGEKFKLIPIVLRDVTFPPLLAPYKRLMATNTTPAQAAAAIVAAVKKPEEIKEREALRGTQPNQSARQLVYVHTTLLPETGYKRLVGREAELKRLDETWLDAKINILSLVAEGGAGKSALVNEWIKRMQAHDYPGADVVLGWSFFSQGTERATSAEGFLNWALEKLGIALATANASAKADAIAEAMMRRRVLLLLDGVEPLQHGPGLQLGQLKDLGLRSLLRRFAATPPGASHGLIVLTSRLAVKDIERWQDGAAPVVDVERLSEEAGSALLHDNGVEGSDKELKSAVRDFGGHPLALGLLASLLKETQNGDVRRSDRVRGLISDTNNPGHDHARRVMESYEKEWLAGQPALLAIMHMIGLFDRPASSDCVDALRRRPIIEGITDQIVELADSEWQRAVTRLREVRLLAPPDLNAPAALDAHPLVREWFGRRLIETNKPAWEAAHGRLYEHLRDTTSEGDKPTLEDLAPLYQAIAHGCRAQRHEEVLFDIYIERICRRYPNGRVMYYARTQLGAVATSLAAISWLFDKPYDTLIDGLSSRARSIALNQAAILLRSQGRFSDALSSNRAAVTKAEGLEEWGEAAISASNLSEAELLVGETAASVKSAAKSVKYADIAGDDFDMMDHRSVYAHALGVAGRHDDALAQFAEASKLQEQRSAKNPLLYSMSGARYCEFLVNGGKFGHALDHATKILRIARSNGWLMIGRSRLGLALEIKYPSRQTVAVEVREVREQLDEAIEALRAAGDLQYIASGLMVRAGFCRNIGDWRGVARDLDEVEELAEPGPMRLRLCEMALARTRLALARIEAFAPLNGMLDGYPSKPELPRAKEIIELRRDAEEQLEIAADYIEKCGYHLRDNELAELYTVLRGEKRFIELPPRV